MTDPENLISDIEAILDDHSTAGVSSFIASRIDPRLQSIPSKRESLTFKDLPKPKFTMEEMENEDIVLARRRELCEQGYVTQDQLDFLEYTEDIDRAIDYAAPQLVGGNKGTLLRTYINKFVIENLTNVVVGQNKL